MTKREKRGLLLFAAVVCYLITFEAVMFAVAAGAVRNWRGCLVGAFVAAVLWEFAWEALDRR